MVATPDPLTTVLPIAAGTASTITALANGGFAVAYLSGTTVFAQIYTSSGQKFGGPITVGTGALNARDAVPEIVAARDGGFSVFWTVNSLGDLPLVGKRYGALGAPIGQQFTVAPDAFTPDAVQLSDGSTAVVYLDDRISDSAMVSRYSASDIKIGADTQVSGTGAASFPVVTALSSGGFIVAWDEFGENFVRYQLFSANGTKVGPVRSADISASFHLGEFNKLDFTTLSNGNVVLVARSTEITAQIITPAGTPLNVIAVNATTVGTQSEVSVTALRDGGFVVTWTDENTGGPIVGQRFGASGVKIGAEFQIQQSGGESLSDIALLPDGRFVVSFESGNNVHTQIFHTFDSLITRGAANDFVPGTAIADLIFAGGGNDNINGLAGNDSIHGEAGNDFINGGLGADIMLGGAGNDVYLVDNAGDRIFEGTGGGTDRVISNVSHVLANNVEHLTLTGAAAINGTGNALTNVITGNAGSNVLAGGAGHDFLTGGVGADHFLFNTALSAATNIDRITDFNAPADTIRLENAIFTMLTAGALAGSAFVRAAASLDAQDRIIYNPATGALSYDADGLGGAAAIRFATLAPNLNVSAADFLVV